MDKATDLVSEFEAKVRTDLRNYLKAEGAMEEPVPVCPDVEECWAEIARAYLPDGAREFQQYPVVSLGWIMFVGMAMAYYWDTDWEKFSTRTDKYESIRAIKGFDNLDEAVVEILLGYEGEAAEKVTELVSRCAARVLSMLNREHVEPGTQTALGCYIAALHELYLAGMAVELNALGYHMTPFYPN